MGPEEEEEDDFSLAVDPGRPGALPLAAMREEEKKIIKIQSVMYVADARVSSIHDKGIPINLFDPTTGAYAGAFDRSNKAWIEKA